MTDLMSSFPYLDEVFKVKARQSFGKKRIIYSSGPKGLYLIGSGQIKVSATSDKGSVLSFPPLSSGDFFGESFFQQPRENERAEALAPSEVYVFDADDIQLAMSNPDFGGALARHLLNKTMLLEMFFERRCGCTTAERLLHLLSYLADKFGTDDNGTRLIPHFTQEYLGQMTGSTREVMTWHMGKLRRIGALAYNRKGIRLFSSFASVKLCPEPQRYAL